MYVLISSFSKLPEIVKPYFTEHCAWLHKYNKLGIFLASGPKKSHLGGVIIVDVDFKLAASDLVRLLDNQ